MFLHRMLSLLKFPFAESPPSSPAQMSCSDCRRVQSCGLAPHDECEERLVQIEMAQRNGLEITGPAAVPRYIGF